MKITIPRWCVFLFKSAIAFFLIGFLIYTTGWDRFWDTLSRVSLFWGALAVVISFFLFLISSLNVWILLRVVAPIGFAKYFQQYARGFVVALFAPGQMGDASITLFLKREGIPIRKSSVVYLLDKTVTMLVYFSVCSWGAGCLVPSWDVWWFKALPLAGFVGLWVVIVCALKFFSKFSQYPRLKQFLIDVQLAVEIFQRRWGILVVNLLVSFLKWGALSFCYFFAFLAFGHTVSWPVIGIIPVLSSLAGYIPVSLGGIGVTEGAAVYLFSLQGVDPSTVLSAYILLRLIQFFIAVILWVFLTRNLVRH